MKLSGTFTLTECELTQCVIDTDNTDRLGNADYVRVTLFCLCDGGDLL